MKEVKEYVKAIEEVIKLEGIETANIANHKALEKKLINLEQFQAGAEVIVKAFLNN